jgi:hypothetical protein
VLCFNEFIVGSFAFLFLTGSTLNLNLVEVFPSRLDGHECVLLELGSDISRSRGCASAPHCAVSSDTLVWFIDKAAP